MSSGENTTTPVLNLADVRMLRESAVWRAKLVVSAHRPLRDAVESGDPMAALGLLQALADEAYNRGMSDHQSVVVGAIDEELAQHEADMRALRGEVSN